MSKCTIDGIKYATVPLFKGEPAFAEDGGPNPNFDWIGWRLNKRDTVEFPYWTFNYHSEALKTLKIHEVTINDVAELGQLIESLTKVRKFLERTSG